RDVSAVIPSRGLSLRGYFDIIRQDPGPDDLLRDWTDQLLARLQGVSTYDLAAEDVDRSAKGDNPARWEKLARVLTHCLANSGEYTYSLEIRRRDRSIDPTLDFLKNVREGHCSRSEEHT